MPGGEPETCIMRSRKRVASPAGAGGPATSLLQLKFLHRWRGCPDLRPGVLHHALRGHPHVHRVLPEPAPPGEPGIGLKAHFRASQIQP